MNCLEYDNIDKIVNIKIYNSYFFILNYLTKNGF